LDEERIRTIVRRVIAEIGEQPAGIGQVANPPARISPAGANEALFPDVDTAVKAAAAAQRQFGLLPLERRRAIVAAMRAAALEAAESLARLAWEETGLGRWPDKRQKNLLVAHKTPGCEDLEPIAWSGDHGLTLMERAPYGVIGAITPVTNPTSTIICNSIGMIAAGNAVVFNVHPNAKRCCAAAVQVLHRAMVAAGAPPNVITSVSNPTIESAQELMRHPGVRLLVVTGGPGVVKEAMNSGKKAICAGPGNPPVVVDETADLEQAGRDIVFGASFDNNVICTDEKEIIVVDSVADRLKAVMLKQGAVEINSWQVERLKRVVLSEDLGPRRHGVVNKAFVGKNANLLLREIGVSAGDDVRLILAEVPADHALFWTEQLMPVIPLVRVRHVDEGIDLAVEVEQGNRHTAMMHSHNIVALSRMARVMDCSIFVKNGPNVAGLGYNGEGYASFTIASPTGEGMTRARHFSRERRCTLVDAFRIV